MSNLIPQKRLNKNGVLVTKHVRPSEETAAASSLPAPSLAMGFSSPKAIADDIVKHYERTYSGTLLTQDRAEWQKTLEEGLTAYSESVLGAYLEVMTANPGGGFEDLIVNAVEGGLTSEEAGYLLFVVQQEDQKEPRWRNEKGYVTYGYSRVSGIARGLLLLRGKFDIDTPEEILASRDERSIAALAAIAKVTSGISSVTSSWGLTYSYDDATGDESGVVIGDDSLIQLIIDHPEQADRIAEVISDRNTTDGEAIRAVIESGHTAVSEGAL